MASYDGFCFLFFFFQAEDGIRDLIVTGVQTCALPIFPDPESLIRRSPASAPLLDAVKDRKTRDAVRSVLERFTGGGAGQKPAVPDRSEERRVGKEGRSRWSPYH